MNKSSNALSFLGVEIIPANDADSTDPEDYALSDYDRRLSNHGIEQAELIALATLFI